MNKPNIGSQCHVCSTSSCNQKNSNKPFLPASQLHEDTRLVWSSYILHAAVVTSHDGFGKMCTLSSRPFPDSCLTNLISVTSCTWILSHLEPQYFVEEEEKKEDEEEEEEDLRTCLFHVQALGVPKACQFLAALYVPKHVCFKLFCTCFVSFNHSWVGLVYGSSAWPIRKILPNPFLSFLACRGTACVEILSWKCSSVFASLRANDLLMVLTNSGFVWTAWHFGTQE